MIAFVSIHIAQSPSVGSVLFNLGFAALPTLAVWRCVSMAQVPVPAYDVRHTPRVMEEAAEPLDEQYNILHSNNPMNISHCNESITSNGAYLSSTFSWTDPDL